MSNRGKLVAEFILIVVGVLVALTVDAWIEDRRNAELKQEYLMRLAEDIGADIDNLRERVNFFRHVRTFGMRTLEWIQSDEPPNPSVLSAAFFSAEVWPFQLITNTYEDLQSTGNLRLLDDFELRMQLASYHEGAEQREPGWTLPEEYRALIRGLIPPDIQQTIRNTCPTTVVNIGQRSSLGNCILPDVAVSAYGDSLQNLRSHPDARQLLQYRVSEVDIAVMLFETQIHLAEPLLEAIEAKYATE